MGRGSFCTLVRKSGIVFAMIAVMAILLTGCEVGEGEGNSGKSSTGTALSGNRYFAHEISLGVDGTAPRRLEQGLRARNFDPGDIVQNVLTPTGEKDVPLDPGSDVTWVAYVPLDLDNSPFRWVRNWREVTPTSGHTFGRSTGSRTIIWTVPEYDPVENPILFSAFGQSGVLTGRSVTISENWRFENYEDDGRGQPSEKSPPVVSVHIGGVDFGGGPSGFEGLRTAHYYFSSTLPGLHTVQNQVVNGSGTGLEGNWSYYQRRMEFAKEFPEYDDSTTEPVEIQNSLQWNDGSAAGEAEWEVSVGDLRKEGTGSEIYALWKPVEEVLERYVDPATVPVGETLERTPLSVKARTPAFSQRWDETGPLYYNITGGTDVPKRTRIKIIEEDVDPEEPFEGDSTSATVTAEVIYFDPELIPQDLNWQVDIKNFAGEVVWNKLATGSGCDISAVWDGTIKGDPLPADDNDPKTYSFALSAYLCDADGGVVVSGRALDDVRAQTLGSEECSPDPDSLAWVEVAIVDSTVLKLRTSDGLLASTESADKPEELVDQVLLYEENTNTFPQITFQVESSSEKDFVEVSLTSSKSKKQKTVKVPKKGGVAKTFEVTTSIQDLIVRKSGAFGIDLSDASSAGDENQDTKAFFSVFQDLGYQPQGRIYRNKFEPGAVLKLDASNPASDPRDSVSGFVPNARSGGFEVLTARVKGTAGKVKLRVKNPADVLYYSGHGLHRTSALAYFSTEPMGENASGELIPQSLNPLEEKKLRTADWENVSVAIIAGCSVLDINDYSHEFDNDLIRRSPDGIEPGIEWDKVIGQGNANLFGYRHFAPLGPDIDTSIINEFGGQIKDQPKNLWPRIWLNANLKHTENDSACALDEFDRYWFVDYGKESRWAWELRRPHKFKRIFTKNRRLAVIGKGTHTTSGNTYFGWSAGRANRDLHHRNVLQLLPDIEIPK